MDFADLSARTTDRKFQAARGSLACLSLSRWCDLRIETCTAASH